MNKYVYLYKYKIHKKQVETEFRLDMSNRFHSSTRFHLCPDLSALIMIKVFRRFPNMATQSYKWVFYIFVGLLWPSCRLSIFQANQRVCVVSVCGAFVLYCLSFWSDVEFYGSWLDIKKKFFNEF